jgi:hypothetical protein
MISFKWEARKTRRRPFVIQLPKSARGIDSSVVRLFRRLWSINVDFQTLTAESGHQKMSSVVVWRRRTMRLKSIQRRNAECVR